MSNAIEEVHSTVTTHHSLIMDGQLLMEEKRNTTITSLETGEKVGEIFCLYQQIGRKAIITTLENGIKKEETDMSAEEKQQFLADWEKLWMPTVNQEDIQKPITDSVTKNWKLSFDQCFLSLPILTSGALLVN